MHQIIQSTYSKSLEVIHQKQRTKKLNFWTTPTCPTLSVLKIHSPPTLIHRCPDLIACKRLIREIFCIFTWMGGGEVVCLRNIKYLCFSDLNNFQLWTSCSCPTPYPPSRLWSSTFVSPPQLDIFDGWPLSLSSRTYFNVCRLHSLFMPFLDSLKTRINMPRCLCIN